MGSIQLRLDWFPVVSFCAADNQFGRSCDNLSMAGLSERGRILFFYRILISVSLDLSHSAMPTSHGMYDKPCGRLRLTID